MVLGELHRLNDLELKYSACSCQLRKSCGLPCACELLAYLNSGEAIPLDSVDIFWRTLDASWSTLLEHEDIQCDDELRVFKETFNKQSNAGKKILLRRLDLNEEPARHSSYVSQSFAKHGSSTVTSDSERFLRHLPQIFHPYLTDLQDVKGDGNCGF
nr:hypothetical protein [Tanacetum cinerariifolium]